MDLDVEANIKVNVTSSQSFKDLIIKQIDLISNEVRANNLTVNIGQIENVESETNEINLEYTKNWNIEEEKIQIQIIKD